MTSTATDSVYLENTAGGSSKFYRLSLVPTDSGEVQVAIEYGKIGAAKPQSGIKFTGSAEAAGAEMAKIADSKRAKGYVDAVDPAA